MALFYDISTADGYLALQDIVLRIDMHLGYIAADGVTPTPIPGRSGWAIGGIYPQVALSIGETTHWTTIYPHPTQAGRYALLIDEWVVLLMEMEIARLEALSSPTTQQTILLNTLQGLSPVSLDSSWQALT